MEQLARHVRRRQRLAGLTDGPLLCGKAFIQEAKLCLLEEVDLALHRPQVGLNGAHAPRL